MLKWILKLTVFAFIFWVFLLPVTCGYIGYAANYGGGAPEQLWLDNAINHLKWIKVDCQDEELNAVIDYTIKRYNKIGPFDVAISRCDWYPMPYGKILGMNNPLVPGITLDISVLIDYDLHTGAGILLHEALHDYYPYLGHSYVDPMIAKMEAQYVYATSNRGSTRSNSR